MDLGQRTFAFHFSSGSLLKPFRTTTKPLFAVSYKRISIAWNKSAICRQQVETVGKKTPRKGAHHVIIVKTATRIRL